MPVFEAINVAKCFFRTVLLFLFVLYHSYFHFITFLFFFPTSYCLLISPPHYSAPHPLSVV